MTLGDESLVAEYSSDDRGNKQKTDDERSNASKESARENNYPRRPQLTHNEHQARQLYGELSIVVRAHTKFESFGDDRVWDTSVLLVRYGINSLESFRTTDETARKYLFEDLRKAEKLSLAKSFLRPVIVESYSLTPFFCPRKSHMPK